MTRRMPYKPRERVIIGGQEIEVLEHPYVSFSNVATRLLDQQSQYASYYVDGRHGSPNLGKGLRFKGNPSDYHSLSIHKDDVMVFVKRVMKYWKEQGIR